MLGYAPRSRWLDGNELHQPSYSKTSNINDAIQEKFVSAHFLCGFAVAKLINKIYGNLNSVCCVGEDLIATLMVGSNDT